MAQYIFLHPNWNMHSIMEPLHIIARMSIFLPLPSCTGLVCRCCRVHTKITVWNIIVKNISYICGFTHKSKQLVRRNFWIYRFPFGLAQVDAYKTMCQHNIAGMSVLCVLGLYFSIVMSAYVESYLLAPSSSHKSCIFDWYWLMWSRKHGLKKVELHIKFDKKIKLPACAKVCMHQVWRNSLFLWVVLIVRVSVMSILPLPSSLMYWAGTVASGLQRHFFMEPLHNIAGMSILLPLNSLYWACLSAFSRPPMYGLFFFHNFLCIWTEIPWTPYIT